MANSSLNADYPWIEAPLVVSAPMRLIATAKLAVATSRAGGIGFIGSGNDQSNLDQLLNEAHSLCADAGLQTSPLPVGVGFLNWGADLDVTLPLLAKYKPAAIWLFAPRNIENLILWTRKAREVTNGKTKVWIQIGSVKEAIQVAKASFLDVLVVQGIDAGGHGLNDGASVMPLVPEISDAISRLRKDGTIQTVPPIIAAGGISDGRGLAAALALGAQGVCMGTRYLAATEAVIAKGYRNEVFGASDGGQSTVRSSVYDTLRGTTDWPKEYGGRGVINQSYRDALGGMAWEENIRLYKEASLKGDGGWGIQGRLTTYAGTAVGLVGREQTAGEITKEVREECIRILNGMKSLAYII